MGILDVIEKLDLDDEVKAQLKSEAESELSAKDKDILDAKRKAHRDDVEQEVAELSDIGFKEAPGLLKFVRRVLLSDDQQPGIVLLSDAELELSGDEAEGIRDKAEMSTAEVVREFIKRMPKQEDKEGNLKVALSDQAIANDGDNPPPPDEDDPAAKSKKHHESAESWTGRKVTRSSSRYRRGGIPVQSGGDS